nr:peroxidase family protein [uncultured Rhodopila sp.]
MAGRDKPAASGERAALAERAARLDLRMTVPVGWEVAPANLPGADAPIRKSQPDPNDNPYIPSGFTYLLQFVAHDLVSTRVPFWATTELDQDTANDRGTRLRLDGLYGGGPTEVPILYAPSDPADLSRAKLRIGQSGPLKAGDHAGLCPFRDIPRVKLDLPGYTEAIVADQRNDDHALISQMTMVFCHLHNLFVELQPAVPADDPAFNFAHDTARLFENAREATTLVYRHVIREDLLKRVLHPAVYAHYSQSAPAFLDGLAGSPTHGVALEFSHAAFRFGHAMVRERYLVNAATNSLGLLLTDALNRFSSGRNVHMQPLAPEWLVLWSNFFNIEGTSNPDRINLSRRIGPRSPVSLFGQAFGPIDASTGTGLVYRDLISAQLADLWPVRDLLAAMRSHKAFAPILAESAFLRDDAWQADIATWLAAGNFDGATNPWAGLTPEQKAAEIASIAANPPLPFFVLFEASKDPDSLGCRLGRFGSILVGDTLFGELNNRFKAETGHAALSDQLRLLHPAFVAADFQKPVTMASVIGFVNDRLQHSQDDALKYPSLI